MNKKEYKDWVGKFGLTLRSWLKVLPCYDAYGKPVELKNAVPLVHYPIAERNQMEERVRNAGFHFAHSTVFYTNGGFGIPIGHEMRALVKDRILVGAV